MPARESESAPHAARSNGPVGEREIVIVRELSAPRSLVFAAFTDPKHLPAWWGPRGFRVETQSIDVRVGGAWRFTMIGPDGTVYPNRILYRAIDAETRIAYDHDADDDSDAGRFAVTLTFDAVGPGRTRVTMHSTFPSGAHRDAVVGFGAVELGASTLEKMDVHVHRALFVEVPVGEPTLRFRRLFAAPRPLLFEAMTRPEHLARWYGPRGTQVLDCAIDPRAGGAWRVVMRGQDGRSHTFSGVYREVVAPERIVQTWTWGGMPGVESIETMHMVDLGDHTLLETNVVHPSVAHRDGHVKNGMEAGASESMERLEALAARLAG
jgi:uncharacterized protein YndB with AHSA1/START domain